MKSEHLSNNSWTSSRPMHAKEATEYLERLLRISGEYGGGFIGRDVFGSSFFAFSPV